MNQNFTLQKEGINGMFLHTFLRNCIDNLESDFSVTIPQDGLLNSRCLKGCLNTSDNTLLILCGNAKESHNLTKAPLIEDGIRFGLRYRDSGVITDYGEPTMVWVDKHGDELSSAIQLNDCVTFLLT
jgi:hypothetical protein